MTALTTLDSADNAPARTTDIASAEAREAQMIQGMIISARKFPRDETAAFRNIQRSCERPTLAEVALYAFPRGGQTVSGPSIRLAEVLKQSWGNIRSGWRELERLPGGSKCYAYAWDIQTNAIQDVEYYVNHVRDTRKGAKQLTDERDIYELLANMGKRRERSCILSVIPGDIVEAAKEKCAETMAKATKLAEAVPKLLKAFSEYEVSQEQIEARIRKKIQALGHSEYVQLRSIYQSLKDGASKSEDWFEALHDPKKIVREQESAAAEATTERKATTDADAKARAIVAFQKAYREAKARGIDPEKILKRSLSEMLALDPTALMAGSDVLNGQGGQEP